MAYQHCNRRGDVYLLQAGQTRTGKPRYYFGRKLSGKPVEEAINTLMFTNRSAAPLLKKLLISAIANAEEDNADLTSLYISESRVDEGPTIKRWRPKDRGRAHPIRKRTSHLYIVVDERN